MKKIGIIFFVFTLSYSHAQNFVAKYDISVAAFADSKQNMVVDSLKYDGFYYQKNAKSITFSKPLFLNKYPNGTIELPTNTVSLCRDSLQMIKYCNLDSMLIRYTNDVSGFNNGVNGMNYFDFSIGDWKVYPEEKEIMGLRCKRATVLRSNGTIICDFWFAIDIPMKVGLHGLVNVPGLLVEGEYIGTHQKIKLVSYSFTEEIDDSIFWPPSFNRPFKEGPKWTRIKENVKEKPKTKEEEKAEIIRQ